MSKEAVQFVELIRQAHSRLEAEVKPRYFWCDHCGMDTLQRIRVEATWEIWTCAECGEQHPYRVG